MRAWITALLNTILPRHPRAENAVQLDSKLLATLIAPVTLASHAWIHALLPYRDERVRALIQAVKYYGESAVAKKVAPFAADYLLEVVAELRTLHGWTRPVIAPIPASPARLRERGYTQASVFAREIATHLVETEYVESLLVREDRPSQVHIPRAKRRHNMVGAFEAGGRAAGRFVILIDDVVESGATLADARRALLDAGAKDVIALAIAH